MYTALNDNKVITMFERELPRYRAELLDKVVPFWERHCIDEKHGGYFTFLDRDGTVYDTDKFAWMQWRIVYMFATLATSTAITVQPSRKERWVAIARQGFDFMTEHGKDAHDMYYFALNRAGEPVIAPYNIYSEAFAVMGSAALYKATGDRVHRDEACSAMDHYLARTSHPKGQWEKHLPASPERLSLGVHMILANLGNVLKACTGVTTYDDSTRDAIETVVEKFWDPGHGVLRENINKDFSFDDMSCDGRHVNPGHGLEALWFILDYAEKERCRALIPRACAMIRSILDAGWDTEHGGIFYFMDVLGKPHVELAWDMKLWWVHCEALVATLLAYRLTADVAFLEWFKKVDAWTWTHFPDAVHDEWFGYLNRRGEPTHFLKGGKWKTFFHLPRSLLVCTDQMQRL